MLLSSRAAENSIPILTSVSALPGPAAGAKEVITLSNVELAWVFRTAGNWGKNRVCYSGSAPSVHDLFKLRKKACSGDETGSEVCSE